MTEKDCVELYQNSELNRYIWSLAHRRSRTHEDAEDYFQEAWVKIWKNVKNDAPIEYYQKIVDRAIDAAYRRKLRRR